MTPEVVTALVDQLNVLQSHVQVAPPNRHDAGQSNECFSEAAVSASSSFSSLQRNQSASRENNSGASLASLLQSNEQVIGWQSPLAGSTASSVLVPKLHQLEESGYLQLSADTGNFRESSPSSSSDSSESSACVPNCVNSDDLNQRQASRRTKQLKSVKQNITGKSNKRSKRLLTKGQNLTHEESELKKHKNRLYARRSREKKSNETKILRERSLEQEAIIEIYKKTLSILHARQAGNTPTWSMRHIEWYPSQAPRHNPPITVKCYFPDYDDRFFCELGNNAYGQLHQSTEVKPTVAATENQTAKPYDSVAVKASNCDSLSSQTVHPTSHYLSTHNLSSSQSMLAKHTDPLSGPIQIDNAQLVKLPNFDTDKPQCSSPSMRHAQSQASNQRFSPYKRPENTPVHQLKEEELPVNLRKLISEVHQNQGTESNGILNVIYISAPQNHLKKTPLSLSSETLNVNTKQSNSNDVKQVSGDVNNPTAVTNDMKKEQVLNVSAAQGSFDSFNYPVSPYQITQNQFSGPWLTNQTESAQGPSTSASQDKNGAILSHVECLKGEVTQSYASAAEEKPHQNKNFPLSIVSSKGMPTSSNIPNVSMLFDGLYTPTSNKIFKPSNKMNECKSIYTNSMVPSHQFKRIESERDLEPHVVHSTSATTTFNNITAFVQQQPSLLGIPSTGNVNTVTSILKPVVNNQENCNTTATLQMLRTPSTSLPIGTSCLEQGIVTITTTQNPFTANRYPSDSGVTVSKMPSVPENESSVISGRLIETSYAQQRPTNSSDDSSLSVSNKTCGLGSLSSFILENDDVELEHLKPTLPD